MRVDADDADALRAQLRALPTDLGELTIRTRAADVLDAARSEAVLRRLPQLRSLTVDGARVLESVVHPRLERLTVLGHDAVEHVLCPELVELTYAAHRSHGTLEYLRQLTDAEAREAHAEGMRARLARWLEFVRILDLTRNERGQVAPHNLGGRTSGYALLAPLSGLAPGQIRLLRLPAPRSEDDIVALTLALRSGAIVEAEIRRMYPDSPPIQAPGVRVPPTVPFRSVDSVHGREAVTLEVGDVSADLALGTLVQALDREWDTLDPARQRDAAAFIAAVEGLNYPGEGAPDRGRFPAAALVRMVDALDLEEWQTVRAAAAAHDEVDVQRYWGW